MNPVYTIGFQIVETLRSHFILSPKEAKERAIELLTLVEIPEPERRFDAFPHQLSGGQRQRAMIAQALACEPQLLVADEPTTALDVTVQAEILKLMRDLRERVNAGIVLITHDMGVVADMADRIVVMQQGIVESGTADQIFNNPQHAYTKQLLAAVPHFGAVSESGTTTQESARRASRSRQARRPLRRVRPGGQGSRDLRVAPMPATARSSVPVDGSRSTSSAARSSGWSASPARASRRSAARRWACSRSPPAPSRWPACSSGTPSPVT